MNGKKHPNQKKARKSSGTLKSSSAPELVSSLRPPENRRMLRLDWIVMAGITLAYALVAFWHLGDRQMPVTNWTPAEGESVVLHGEEPCQTLFYLPGLAPDANH